MKFKISLLLALILGVMWGKMGFNMIELVLIIMALVSGILLAEGK